MSSAPTAPLHRARSVIEAVDAEMSCALDDSSSKVASAIHENVPGLSDDLYVATRASTRANVGLITAMIARGADPSSFAAPEEALAYARRYVHEGLSLEQLARVYREGQQAYLKLWLERLHDRASDTDVLTDSLGYFSDWLFTYIETIRDPLAAAYTAEHERWIRGNVALRSEEVRAILADPRVDAGETSSRLGYRLDSQHVAFVIWDDTNQGAAIGTADGEQMHSEMERFAAGIVESLKATSSLALPVGCYYAGWAAVPGEATIPDLPAGRSGLRAALGRPGRGIQGFRRSHQEAQRARRVATLARRPSTASVSFDALALDALLTHDLDEARRFVEQELGALAEDSDSARRLAATLQIFLQEESSFVRAGRRLGIHENTVAYRIRRAEELLGHRVAERAVELRAALRIARFVADGA